jgi:polyisoprenoid-binding protein YceI
MRRLIYVLIGLVIVGGVVAVGAYALLVATSGDGRASEEISAPELAAQESSTVYRIVPEESEVRFSINEVLRGEPFTAVGITNDVAGDIAVNAESPQDSEIGIIRINARTLETDSSQRNRALRSFILRSAEDAFEFAEFQPTTIEGLPETVTVGEPFTFQIVGDLSVAGTSKSVTFDTTATLEEGQLMGQATATVLYPDFNLTIPSAPFVASVEDEVLLEIDFVAQAVEEGV